ncbi:MAG: 3'(2'),5'-bisphosphate nucleotidase [Phycisphaerae bacterium]|nr:3'(2'),5'-bisphosphate nucleotidase [Phycisphaerae bacterium]
MTEANQMIIAGIHAVATAAQITRTVQANLEAVITLTKDDRSPVTVADLAAQAVVALLLEEHLPDPADRLVVGEEDSGALQDESMKTVRDAVVSTVQQWRPSASEQDVLDAIDHCDHDGSAGGYWTLDPIDGTKGFLRNQQYAIALGRIEDGVVVHGVMGCPALPVSQDAPLDIPDPQGVLYAASRGEGAWEFAGCDPEADRLGIRARSLQEERPLQFCGSVEKAHSSRSDADRIAEHLGNVGEPVRIDSQCKYALVSRGQADAYLRLPTRKGYVEKIWDHAAGSIIAEEAGVTVTDIQGNPLDFSHGAGLHANRGVIAAVPALHGRLIESIKELGIGMEEEA